MAPRTLRAINPLSYYPPLPSPSWTLTCQYGQAEDSLGAELHQNERHRNQEHNHIPPLTLSLFFPSSLPLLLAFLSFFVSLVVVPSSLFLFSLSRYCLLSPLSLPRRLQQSSSCRVLKASVDVSGSQRTLYTHRGSISANNVLLQL